MNRREEQHGYRLVVVGILSVGGSLSVYVGVAADDCPFRGSGFLA
jgi:hypothetical protein